MSMWVEKHYVACKIEDANTESLFNTIKFMFNNLAPEHLKLDKEKVSFNLSGQQQVKALKALIKELSKRSDITPFMWEHLIQMNENCKQFGGANLLEDEK